MSSSHRKVIIIIIIIFEELNLQSSIFLDNLKWTSAKDGYSGPHEHSEQW